MSAEAAVAIIFWCRLVKDLFDSLDLDGSGYLELVEVRRLIVQLGERLTEIEVQEALHEMVSSHRDVHTHF